MYGDDAQMATNYPLVRVTYAATGHMAYFRTRGHSSMGVATGSTVVSTNFDVPLNAELGAAQLEVVANGIASAPYSVSIDAGPLYLLSATLKPGKSGSYTVNIKLQDPGSVSDANVAITSASLGAAQTSTKLPVNVGNIAAGATRSAVLGFGSTAGSSGNVVTLTVSGTFTGGTFTGSLAVTLP